MLLGLLTRRNPDQHLEQIITNLQHLLIVFQLVELCLQLFVDDLGPDELVLGKPSLVEKIVRNHPSSV